MLNLLIMFVVSVVLSELLRPKPKLENARPAGLGDFQFPTATEGRAVPLIWGRIKTLAPNVVWYGDLRQDPIQVTVKTGLWSSKKQIIGFKYFLGMQMALCRGPGVSLRKVWIGDTEVFSGNVTSSTSFDIDLPDLFGGDDMGAGGIRATCDWFIGSTTQTVSPYLDVVGRQRIASAITPGAPRYSGTCYLIAREIGVAAAVARGADLGNSTTIKPWSFEIDRYPSLFTGQTGTQNKIGVDANPMNVIYEILTDTEWGLGFPTADIDAAGTFLSASNTLITEGNGFSMLLDQEIEAIDLLREVERQIDGIVFLDHRTGLWKIKLARSDYDVNTVPQVNDSNAEVADYTKGSWEDTTNQIVVKFSKRSDQYKESYALAQDMANTLIQGAGTVLTGTVISAQADYPGIKDSGLANNVAWRDLRLQAYPLARATFTLDRSFWDLTPVSVFAWTSAKFGFTKLPMRVTSINYGKLEDGKIVVQAVQDIFKYQEAVFADPPGTLWDIPSVSLIAFPADEQLAFEAPRALIIRDPEFEGDPTVAKVYCSARRQSGESSIQLQQRHASGVPSGNFANAGVVYGFMKIGQLSGNLAAGVASPTATITITADPDSQAVLEGAFNDSITLPDLGVNLIHLIRIGTEFMLVQSAANNSTQVDLQNVYRGILDSVQTAHTAGDSVYLLFSGSGLMSDNFTNTDNVDVRLRMRNASGTFSGATTTVSLTMDKRTMRPYAPAAILFNGSGTPWTTPGMDSDVACRWWRRDYRIADELQAVLADDPGVDPSTEYQLEVRADPAGANVLVGSLSSWTTGAGPLSATRADIVTAAAAGTLLRFILRSRHDLLTETNIQSRHELTFDTTPTSTLTTQFYFGGGVAANVATSSYTALATGTYSLTIAAAQTTAAIQYRLNGGAWTSVIAAGLVSGTFAVTSGDTIELRRTVSEAPNPNFFQLSNPSATAVGYGTFKS